MDDAISTSTMYVSINNKGLDSSRLNIAWILCTKDHVSLGRGRGSSNSTKAGKFGGHLGEVLSHETLRVVTMC